MDVQFVPSVDSVDRPRSAARCRLVRHVEQLGRQQHGLERRAAKSLAQVCQLRRSLARDHVGRCREHHPTVCAWCARCDLTQHHNKAATPQEAQLKLVLSLGRCPVLGKVLLSDLHRSRPAFETFLQAHGLFPLRIEVRERTISVTTDG